MKYFVFLLLFVLLFLQESTAQIRLNDLLFYRDLRIVHDDSVSRIISIDDNSNTYWVDSVYFLNNNFHEYHEKGIITQRSFLVSGSNKYMLDSLIIKNYYDFGLSLDIDRVYSNNREKCEYLIIECYNVFQYGTDTQPIFIVLAKEMNYYTIQSVYIMDDYSEDTYNNINIQYDNDKIIMRGEGVSLIFTY